MRPAGRMNARGIPARTLDLLETDGGWLTADGIALALGAEREPVDRALFRLRGRGLVEARRVDLVASVPRNRTDSTGWAGYRPRAFGEPGHGGEWRTEWRFKTWGEWYV